MANSTFDPDDVLVCTPLGVRATNDQNSTLAPGFREVLRAINGKRAVKDLQSLLPQVDPLKIAIWLDDARRMDLIKLVAAPVEEAAKPGAAFEYGAYIEKDEETAALARDIARWAKLKPQSGVRSRVSDLNKTVQMATLQSGEALESLANSGVFTNSMPALEADAAPMFPPIAVTPPAGVVAAPAPVAPMAQKYALIVEDDIAELGSLAGLLGAAGYMVRAAGTRRQFIDEMNRPEPASVIFLKLESTVLDVFKTLDRIRAHPQLGSIPVVISGAAPSREEIAKSILLGASGWVVRPYTREKVAAALHGALTPPR
ncbi:MAG TPA: response regulator [Burkholderiales bacterium]